jgi:hypothetical protein
MTGIKISIINESTVVGDDDVARATVDLQTQVSRDFSAAWGIDADLIYVPRGSQPSGESWWLTILDDTDQAGALGYHDTTNEGLPLGKVFAKTDIQAQTVWTVTASHELLEMLGDPDINLNALVQQNGNLKLYAYEVADACEADEYGYTIRNTLVSDFVFPGWFQSFVPDGTKLDQQGKIQRPFELLPGGYISVMDITTSNGWQQVSGSEARDRYSSRAHVGSRRERRRTPRGIWLKSTKLFSAATSPRAASDSYTIRGANQRLFRVEGKVSVFGGPHDRWASPTRRLALFENSDLDDPRYKDLFLAGAIPGETGLARRLNPDANYVACRWEFGLTSRDFLRQTQVVVSNSRTGATAFASPIDWGPSASTGHVALVSPGLAKILGLATDDEVSVSVSLG